MAEIGAKKDNIMKLLYNIFIASSIALFIFLFILFLGISTLTPTTLKSYINAQFNSLKLSIFVLAIFFLALLFPYRGNKIQEILTILAPIFGKIYSKKIPHIIMGMGYSLMLALFLIVINFGFKSTGNPITLNPYELTVALLMALSFFLILIGIILFILGFYAKISLERKVYFTGRSGWIVKNRDTIVNVVIMIVSIITVILAYLQYQKT